MPRMSAVATTLAALALLAGAVPAGAQPAPRAAPTTLAVLAGASVPLEGALRPWSDDSPERPSGAPSAQSPVMALDAEQGANIDRIRASLGGAIYKPTVVCGSNVTIGGTQGASGVIPSQTVVGNVTVLSAGACPAGQQPSK